MVTTGVGANGGAAGGGGEDGGDLNQVVEASFADSGEFGGHGVPCGQEPGVVEYGRVTHAA